MISIIIPAYNVEEYIEQCLQSIIDQSYSDFEVIVIDDGSDDDTFMKINEYVTVDERIQVYQKRNGGQASARNIGLSKIRGEYFTFVDSDDVIERDYLRNLVNTIEYQKTDISMCGMIYKCGTNQKQICCEDNVLRDNESIIKAFLSERFLFGPVSKLFRSDLFSKVQFTEGIIFEDVEYLSRIYVLCNSVALSEYAGYIYNVHENSTVHSKFDTKKLDLLIVTDMIEKNLGKLTISCEQEFQNFRLNSYLSILLMLSETRKYRRYTSICMPLVSWIRTNKRTIKRNKCITIKKKIYSMIFALNIDSMIYLMLKMRRIHL